MIKTSGSDKTLCGRLLLIDSDSACARQTSAELLDSLLVAPQITHAAAGREAADYLRKLRFDVIICDLDSLSDLVSRVEDAMSRLVRLADGALVLAVADSGSVSAALGAMRAGAHDYVAKPTNGSALAGRLAELAQRHGRPRSLGVEVTPEPEISDFAGFVGASSAMQFLYEQIGRVAASAAPVFITGESGTGKDVCAEALHSRGPRAGSRFVAINCAAIPRDLMESELFG